MNISALIVELEKMKAIHGDIAVCTTEEHEYWGLVYNKIAVLRVDERAQPQGPKSGVSEKAIIFSAY